MKPLSGPAKAYIGATALLGALAFVSSLVLIYPHDLLRYAFYLTATVLASQMKVRLPGITGTISVNFLFILIGILELDLPQTLSIGIVGTIAQSVWNAKNRPQPIQLWFNLSSITVSTAVSWYVYHSPAMHAISSSVPMLLVATTTTFFLFNTISVSSVIALTEGKPLAGVWQESFVWTAPQYLVGATLAGCLHALGRHFGWEVAILAFPAIYLVYSSFDLYLNRLEAEKKHVTEMADLHLRTIEALALAIDAKDDTTHHHLQRVKVYATEIGKELGLAPEEMQSLQAGAMLHDIGKLAVPEYIISKPGKLTPEEFEKMKIHPVVGAEILERVRFPYPVVPVVRSHHERWDGSGYPDGLKGEEIPVGARILGAVDALDALSSDRQYRRALPIDDAMAIVAKESGTSFDPKIVTVLQRRYRELEQMARAVSAEGSKLSTNTRVERGAAPAAGFETIAPPPPAPARSDFIHSVAAARQEFHLLVELLNDLGTSLTLEDTLSVLATRLKHMVPHDSVAIYLLREGRLVPQLVNGEEARLFSSLEIPVGQGLSGWVAENRRPIVNGNPSVEPGYLNDPAKFSKMRSALSVPLEGLSGVVGVLTLYRIEADAFTQDHLRILLAISTKAGLAIENSLRYRLVETSPVIDELTGLPNARSLFLHLDSELARARRSQVSLNVVVIDLDGFKQVNDRFGHLKGNRVLQLIGRGIKDSCRDQDYVARMGGDEFVVILPGSRRDGLRGKIRVFREIARNVGIAICGEDFLSLSAGDACFPEEGTDAEQILAAADKRMYQAKQAVRTAQVPMPLPDLSAASTRIQ